MIEVAVFPKFLYVEAINLLVFILIMKLVSKILSFLNKKKYVNNDGSQLRVYSIIKGYIYAIAVFSILGCLHWNELNAGLTLGHDIWSSTRFGGCSVLFDHQYNLYYKYWGDKNDCNNHKLMKDITDIMKTCTKAYMSSGGYNDKFCIALSLDSKWKGTILLGYSPSIWLSDCHGANIHRHYIR